MSHSLIPNSTEQGELTRVFRLIETQLNQLRSNMNQGSTITPSTNPLARLSSAPPTAPYSTDLTAIYTNLTTINNTLPLLAPLDSPVFTGNPTAPTTVLTDNSTSLATTAFVKGQVIDAEHGGTGLTAYALGDMLYASAANVLSTLAGYTTAAMAVLTMTGTGTASAAPVWTATTGTGNVVRATSPTLVTPSLGVATATSLVVSSLTAGRVTFAGVSGLLSDFAGFTYTSGTTAGGLAIPNTTVSTSPTTGSLVNAGGFGCSGAIFAGSSILTNAGVTVLGGSYLTNTLLYSPVYGTWLVARTGTANDLEVSSPTGADILYVPTGTVDVKFASATASTSTTTGSITTPGGVGIGGALNIGGNITVAAAHQVYFTGTGFAGIGASAAGALELYAGPGSQTRFFITQAGDASFNGNAVSMGALTAATVKTNAPTVAGLPTGTIGMHSMVTDALAPTYMATVVGGGAVVTPVFHDGVSWKVG